MCSQRSHNFLINLLSSGKNQWRQVLLPIQRRVCTVVAIQTSMAMHLWNKNFTRSRSISYLSYSLQNTACSVSADIYIMAPNAILTMCVLSEILVTLDCAYGHMDPSIYNTVCTSVFSLHQLIQICPRAPYIGKNCHEP